MTQSFVNCSGVLIAEMDAPGSVDNDSGVGHKKRASQCDFIQVYMKKNVIFKVCQKMYTFYYEKQALNKNKTIY